MRDRMMPSHFDTQPSEFAGQDAEYANKQVLQTTSGERVMIIDYKKDEGLYVVSNIDKPETTTPPYKISPDKLVKPEGESK